MDLGKQFPAYIQHGSQIPAVHILFLSLLHPGIHLSVFIHGTPNNQHSNLNAKPSGISSSF
ncbi:hypothetical protein LLB_3258 [Legionella longbeachae D-4968]|nr:hypothetical protein LLB_3258 [Legionella longbeachae D-4968]